MLRRAAPARSSTYAAAALPVLGIALYLAVGSPQLPGRPYAARLDMPVDQATAADLVARVEAHLRQHPEDGRGWDVLAPVYLRMGDYTQAADAFQKAARLLGNLPSAWPASRARSSCCRTASSTSRRGRRMSGCWRWRPQSIEPKVWLAIAREQDGDLEGRRGRVSHAARRCRGAVEGPARGAPAGGRVRGTAVPRRAVRQTARACTDRVPRPPRRPRSGGDGPADATSSSTRWSKGSPRGLKDERQGS